MILSTAEALKTVPVNAWLLVGDEASYPTSRELKRARRKEVSDDIWTAPSQAQPGDLLLFYFVDPVKEVRFAARAASHPFFDSSVGVNALGAVDPHQWWITHTPLVETPPVTFKELAEAWGGHVILRGKPRHYLPPSVVGRLQAVMAAKAQGGAMHPELASVVQLPVGDPVLPDIASLTPEAWSRIADGVLMLERQVEQYVVEPLLRMALADRPGYEVMQAYRLPDGGVPDYAIAREGTVTAVVEAKVGIAEPRDSNWAASAEFAQIRRYMDRLGVPGLLVDSRRAYLIEPGAAVPSLVVARTSANAADLQEIGRHLTGPGSDGA